MEKQPKSKGIKNLECLCIDCVLRNLKSFSEEYITGTNVPKKHFEFLQRTHSKDLLNVLVDDEKNLVLFREFVLNSYLKEIDLSKCSFSWVNIQLVIRQLKSIGETVKQLSIVGDFWTEGDLIELTSSLPNVESLSLCRTRTSRKVLENVQKYCKALQKLNLCGCKSVNDNALKELCTKDQNLGYSRILLSLDVSCTSVTIDGVAFILKNFSTLQILNHEDVCQWIYYSHFNDLINNSLSDTKYSLTKLVVKRIVDTGYLCDREFLLNSLKMCLVICPNLSTLAVLNVESQAEIDACSEFHDLEEIYLRGNLRGWAPITFINPTVTPFVEYNGKNLTVLVVSELDISGESVLKCCPKLQYFSLRNAVFEPLKASKNDNHSYSLPDFKKIHIDAMDFGDEVLTESIDLVLSSAPNLEMLSFISIENLTLDFVRSIAKYKCMSTVLKVDVSSSKIQFPVAREILVAAPNLENFGAKACGISRIEYENLITLRDDVNIEWVSDYYDDDNYDDYHVTYADSRLFDDDNMSD